ncbi:hypothetical protein [Nostoc sp. WHI]|uniref:hypothetical protein n=1 Tax=Nostoc sp. WHI TaxID=2650611 RepID=UPI0018C68059|nr:hypothetical protein [Nostoc sp. WHI]MBG1267763.1 hypothetical protein [Nostoc sp. WHI]
MTVRAKFTCQVKDFYPATRIAQIVLTPVTTDPPNPENLTFWKATPAGAITLQIDNPLALAQFSVGVDYYVDFTPAE